MRIGIIGAGISGLTTAFYIKKFLPEASLKILEQESECGGKIKTHNISNFLIEQSVNGFLSNKPDTLQLADELGISEQLLYSNDLAAKRYIFVKKLHLLPESPRAFLKTKLLSSYGKLRVLAEFLIPSKRDESEESVQKFGNRRFGKEFTEVFLDAMTAGIFASTPEKLCLGAAFPAVAKLEKEYGGLFKGMIAKKKKEAGPGGKLVSFKNGMEQLVETLARSVSENILTNCEVLKLEKHGNTWVTTTNNGIHEFDRVVICTPAYSAAKILKDLDEKQYEILKNIEYSPVAVVALGYENLQHPLDGFGLLTTKKSNMQILGILWDSSIYAGRAEEGKQLLRVMIGGQRNPMNATKSEDELIELARTGVTDTMGVYDKPVLTKVFRWHKGIPNYKVGHLRDMAELFESTKKHTGMFLNSNAYFGIGINDCVKNSKECAKRISGIN